MSSAFRRPGAIETIGSGLRIGEQTIDRRRSGPYWPTRNPSHRPTRMTVLSSPSMPLARRADTLDRNIARKQRLVLCCRSSPRSTDPRRRRLHGLRAQFTAMHHPASPKSRPRNPRLSARSVAAHRARPNAQSTSSSCDAVVGLADRPCKARHWSMREPCSRDAARSFALPMSHGLGMTKHPSVVELAKRARRFSATDARPFVLIHQSGRHVGWAMSVLARTASIRLPRATKQSRYGC